MSIESLKQQARKHEQNEDWKKALDHYNKALAELAREEQVDIGLYNRVGDLYVRVGDLDKAVEHYDKAVELYREAYLPNNAIAVCKKIIRNVPERHRAYLLMGQIRAEQGFIPDARTNFLTYAERMSQAGDLDESFRALIEFCDLAPDDVGVRLTVADQMVSSGRTEEAVEQLLIARRHYNEMGKSSEAQDIESRILQLDPEADLSAVSAMASPTLGSDDDAYVSDFGEIALGGDAFDSGSEEEVSFAVGGAMEEASATSDEADADLGGFEISAPAGGDQDDEDDGGFELPMMALEDGDDEDAAGGLPLMEMDSEEESDGGFDLPLMSVDDEDDGGDADEAAPLPMMDVGDDDEDAGFDLPTMELETEPMAAAAEDSADDLGLTLAPEAPAVPEVSEAVEAAMEEVSAGADFALPEPEAPAPEPEMPAAQAPAPEETPAAPAAPADGGFIDFGAMILGDTKQKDTRIRVAYQEPSGDEEADFARMLSQFKEKVSENLDSSDVRAHYDLGTAYKEMGLLDEAISSFQAALRASADHLPTYELMGQTFLEMNKPEAAVKSLERALESASTVEDELVGIYYYLGRAYEALQNRESAVEYYDRVFSLDINFADVTDRLRELR